MEDLRHKTDDIELLAGDMLIDSLIGTIGILMQPENNHHTKGYYYNSKFWKIFWISNNEEYDSFYSYTYVEEYGLKMSILIGIYEYYCVNKQEKI